MKSLIGYAIIIVFLSTLIFYHSVVVANTDSFGGSDNVTYASKLWDAMENASLVGASSLPHTPYKGIHPHGAVLETITSVITIDGHKGSLFVKRNYGGIGVSIQAASANRGKFISDITIMFKREVGYDSENRDWFWAKYKPDGSLEATPNGVKLAGRIAKGKPKGCIACHSEAPGGDFLFVN